MVISELITQLEGIKMSRGNIPIFVSKDEEGNGFSELYSLEVLNQSKSSWSDFYSDQDINDEEEDPADFNTVLVLWP